MITFDTSPLRTNIVAAFSPHAGRSLEDKTIFYNELGKVLDSIPQRETNIILGDFNARLMERHPHEAETLGEHMIREDARFIRLCQEHGLTVVNTLFQKDKSKLITYRNVAAPNFHPPTLWTPDRYGQLDFMLINKKWKNTVTNAESNLQTGVTMDHKSYENCGKETVLSSKKCAVPNP